MGKVVLQTKFANSALVFIGIGARAESDRLSRAVYERAGVSDCQIEVFGE